MSYFTLNNLGWLGVIVLVVVLQQRYGGLPRARAMPRYGSAGSWLLIGSLAANAFDVVPVEMLFTPLCWTGYILWADGVVAALRGRALLSDNRRAFWLLAAASVPLWVIFEIYNLRLANWVYAGLPSNPAIRYGSFVWAFATVWPGIFVTAALLRAMGWFNTEDTEDTETGKQWQRQAAVGVLPAVSMALGAVLLIIPPLLPPPVSVYLFGFVWLGPVLLLDPLNMRAGRESLWADLRAGRCDRLRALLLAGAVCGLLWEFWNYSAAARWHYTFPIFHEYRVFAMPVAGYLGFPVFALDCFAMYALIEPALRRLTRTAKGSPPVLDL